MPRAAARLTRQAGSPGQAGVLAAHRARNIPPASTLLQTHLWELFGIHSPARHQLDTDPEPTPSWTQGLHPSMVASIHPCPCLMVGPHLNTS